MTPVVDWPLMGRDQELRDLTRALTQPQIHGAVIVGPSGAGKTRLVQEVVAVAAGRGARVERVTASASSRTLPFGALAHLLPPAPPGVQDRVDYLRHALASLGQATPRLVLSVDDAPLLDDGSAALIHMLARSGSAFLLLTARSEDPVPEAITALWKDSLLDRIELGPLPPAVVQRLAERALDGPLAPTAAAEISRLAEGNPLLLREVILHAVENGVLRRESAQWRWEGQIGAGGRLVELVEHRLAHLEPELRDLVDTIAFGGSLDLALAEHLGSLDQIETLERHALATIEGDAAPATVRLTHPVVGEVIRESAPRARARRARRRLADAAETAGLAEREPVRYALWRLDGGGDARPEHLVAAARRAATAFDHALTERLARAAIEAGAGFEATLLLAAALSARALDSAAMTAFEQARASAADDRERTDLALAEAQHQLAVRHDPPAALALLRDASRAAETPDSRDEIDARFAMYAAMGGDVHAAIDAGERMQRRHDAAPVARVSVYLSSTIAQVMAGRGDDAARPLRDALELAPAVQDQIPMAPFLLRMTQVTRHTCAGDLLQAERLCRAARDDAAEAGAPVLRGLCAQVLGDVLVHRGLMHEAAEVLAEARALCLEEDPLSLLDMARALGAAVAAWTGDAAAAETLLGSVEPTAITRDARVRFHADRAAAWRHALEGDLAAATDVALQGGRRAIKADHVVWGAYLLHDAARLGAPELVAAELADLAADVDGVLVAALAAHAEALVAGDGDEIEAAARTFDEIGAALLGAEAFAQAAAAHRRSRRAARVSAATVRAGALLGVCGGVRTPALLDLHDPLTTRERQIAFLAAGGASSAEIGARLGIAVRTVDNHLGSVYAKLDVSGRQALREMLGSSTTAAT